MGKVRISLDAGNVLESALHQVKTSSRIPAPLLAAAGLKVGRYVTIRVLDNGDIRVRPVGPVVTAEQSPEIGEPEAAKE